MSAQVLTLDAGEVGARIRTRRVELGISQFELKRRAGVSSDGTLSYIENGRNLPGLDLAVRIADVLNVTVDWLCGRAVPVVSSPTLPQGAAQAHVTGGGTSEAARASHVERVGGRPTSAAGPHNIERGATPGAHPRPLENSVA